MAEILGRATSLPVSDAIADSKPLPNHIYIIPPCYRETEFNANASTIRKNYRLLKELYPDIVCASPDDFVFRSDCFFDTAYHLNQKGRDERTARVVACLQNRGLK